MTERIYPEPVYSATFDDWIIAYELYREGEEEPFATQVVAHCPYCDDTGTWTDKYGYPHRCGCWQSSVTTAHH